MKTAKNGKELAAVLDKIGVDLDKELASAYLAKLALEGFRYAIMRTPVRTGFLRSRWGVTTASLPTPLKNPNPASTYAPKQPSVQGIKWGDRVVIYNNAEYAEYIDQGTPHMRAQPMIEPTRAYLVGLATRLAKLQSGRKIND